MIKKGNSVLSNKERIDQEKPIEILNIFNQQSLYIPHVNQNDLEIPKYIDNYIPLEQENIILEEIKNIMGGKKNELDEDEEEYEDIYFIKKPKMELHSTDTSTKFLTIPENKENDSVSKTVCFKTMLHCKRGRKIKEGKKRINQKIHCSTDFDNIQRKIQVNFITFLIRLGNDALKSIFGKKTKFHFKDVKYELKKIVNHNYIEHLKQCNYSDIIKMKISPKNKRFGEDENLKTFTEICKYSDKLRKLFDKNYLYLFQKYYCNLKNEDNIDLDGIKINLSPKTKTFYFPLRSFCNEYCIYFTGKK